MNSPKRKFYSPYNSLCYYLDKFESKKYLSYSDSAMFSKVCNDYFQANFPEYQVSNELNLYSKWKETHEMDISDEEKIKVFTQKETIILEPKLDSLSDLISFLEKTPYDVSKEYNINLKCLHDIEPELIQLNEMIGIENIKHSIMYQLLYFIQGFANNTEHGDYKHTVLMGPPGTGKTEIAKLLGKMYAKMGILKSKTFKKVTRTDLVAGYLGQTAIKTRKVIDECMNGVLFIDEAYSLQPDDNFAKECVDTLCEALSDHKNNLMVIIAGYEKELLDTIFKTNEGLKSRFIWSFSIDSYSPKELYLIFKHLAKSRKWEVGDSIKCNWFESNKEYFSYNGRTMEQLFTYCKICHSKRIYGKTNVIAKQLNLDDINDGLCMLKQNCKKENKFFGLYI